MGRHTQRPDETLAGEGVAMSRVLVNIRGCNGAGKSTIPLSMMDDPNMYVHEIVGSDGKKISAITVFPSYGWAALGTYFNKTGGLDTLKNNEITKMTLFAALDGFPEYDVLMEGVMASTIRSTYIDLFHEIEAYYGERKAPVKVLIMSLLPPLDVAISRVYKRNGGKPIKEEAVAAKWGIVARNVGHFSSAGFTSIRVNSAKVKKKGMFPAFLKTVNKYRRK